MKKFVTSLLIFSVVLVFASLSFVAADSYGMYKQVNYDNNYNDRYDSYSDYGMKYSSDSYYTPCKSCQISKPLIIYDRTPDVHYYQHNVQKCVTCIPQHSYYKTGCPSYSSFSYTY